MASVKAKLKAAREAIGAKEWGKAEKAARDVIDVDSSNYNAHVFLGLALASASPPKDGEAEQVYRKAVASAPKQLLAWQGLATLHENQGKSEEVANVYIQIMDVCNQGGDPQKLAETLQKLIALRRQHGSRTEIMNVLSFLLPSSPYFQVLASLPQPDITNPTASHIHSLLVNLSNTLPTIQELVYLAQTEESNYISKELAARRMRLSSASQSPAEQKAALVREVYPQSRMPSLWREVINHPNASDDDRQQAEASMLDHARALLEALPSPFPSEVADFSTAGAAGSVGDPANDEKIRDKFARDKDALRTDVEEMARGQVVVGRKNEKAYEIVLDWGEVLGPDSDPRGYLQDVEDVLPRSNLAKMLRILRRIFRHPEEGENAKENGDQPSDDEDLLSSLEAAFQPLQSHSIVAHHLLMRAYAHFREYALLVPLVDSGLSLVASLEPLIGTRLLSSRRAFEVPLATALVQWEAPKHHLRATRIVTRLLDDEEGRSNVEVLLAKAAIESGRERWEDAEGWYGRVMKIPTATAEQRTEAKGEGAWCLAMEGRSDQAIGELEQVIEDLEAATPEGLDERGAIRLAQAWYRLGRCRWEGSRRDAKGAFAAFVKAIKWHSSFAPAFTYLGLYYLEGVAAPDYDRASKCFQKAFELDAREDVAAKKLAEEFVEDREWDLVEVVARRVIEGTGGRSSAGSLGGPLATRLAWAWLALGSAELAKKRYISAVSAFQSAVRGSPQDAHAWLKLGLAYRGAGKHVAALKTFAKALTLAPDLWWASFCVGDVQRALGLLDPAIAAFEKILDDHPDEIGVRVVLAGTLLSRAVEYVKASYIARAEDYLVKALAEARTIIEAGLGIRIAWKVVGDAFSELGRLRSLEIGDELRSHLSFFVNAVAQAGADAKMPSIDAISALEVSSIAAEHESPALFIVAAALAYKIRVLLELQNEAGVGSAWLDLGVALSRLKETKGSFKLTTSEETVLKQAIQAVRFALQHEPTNPSFWNVLGVLSFELSPRLAQHAFIKAIEHHERSPIAWSNLGYFYLTHGDRDLANQAFLKAQVNDPEWGLAWVGQALLAAVNGDIQESAMLVEHAFSFSSAITPEADLSFATAALRAFTISHSEATISLAPAFFAVSRVLQRDNSSPSVLHLHALLAERLSQLDDASSSFEKCAELLEAQYEEDESPETEARYVTAFANLGRVRVAMGEYTEASEAFETVLSLRPPQLQEEGQDKGRLQALVGDGLAKFFAEDLEGSLTAFQTLLDEAPPTSVHRRRAALLLARVLWAIGGEDQRQEARQTLLDVIGSATGEEETPDLSVVSTLAAMGVIEDDPELVDAAVAEIIKLPRDQRKELDPEMLVDEVLVAQHICKGETREATAILVSSAHITPSSARSHHSLASHLLRTGIAEACPSAEREAVAASMLVEASPLVDAKPLPRSAVDVLDTVSRLRSKVDRTASDAQRAIFVSPGSAGSWRALALSELREPHQTNAKQADA